MGRHTMAALSERAGGSRRRVPGKVIEEKPKQAEGIFDCIAEVTEEETNGSGQRRSRRERHGTKEEGQFWPMVE